MSLASTATAATYIERDDVQQFIDRMVSQHQFTRAELEPIFAAIEVQPKVLNSIKAPAEKKKQWHQYRAIFVTERRIAEGVDYWNSHSEKFKEAEAQYGVPAEIILAVMGVETYYGRRTGGHPVLDSLVTLGFDYSKRGKFFRSELEHYFLLCREEGLPLTELKGSYAGAMGKGQFIASSYRHYAVDKDGDGSRDLWGSDDDAIASIANYFAKHGWRSQQPVTQVIKTSVAVDDIDHSNKLKPSFSVDDLKAQGFNFETNYTGPYSLISLQNKETKEYWLGYRNFYVITRYNHSAMYAMAVYQLSQELKKRIDLNAK
jgi:membrane-bound lytic murein transglycosylase B